MTAKKTPITQEQKDRKNAKARERKAKEKADRLAATLE